MKSKYTQSLLDKIKKDRISGLTIAELSEEYNIPAGTLYGFNQTGYNVKKYKEKFNQIQKQNRKRRVTYTQATLDKAKEMIDQGFSYWQISKRIDISILTLNRFSEANYDLKTYKLDSKKRYEERFKHNKDVFITALDLVKKQGYGSIIEYIQAEGHLSFKNKITPCLKQNIKNQEKHKPIN